jgi:hypothetical protein
MRTCADPPFGAVMFLVLVCVSEAEISALCQRQHHCAVCGAPRIRRAGGRAASRSTCSICLCRGTVEPDGDSVTPRRPRGKECARA